MLSASRFALHESGPIESGPIESGPIESGLLNAGLSAQSLKLLHCSGIPKSSAFTFAMTSWRSSRFLPETRS